MFNLYIPKRMGGGGKVLEALGGFERDLSKVCRYGRPADAMNLKSSRGDRLLTKKGNDKCGDNKSAWIFFFFPYIRDCVD